MHLGGTGALKKSWVCVCQSAAGESWLAGSPSQLPWHVPTVGKHRARLAAGSMIFCIAGNFSGKGLGK